MPLPTPRAANVAASPPAMPWNDEIAHWLLTTLRITGALIDGGERQRAVEVGLGGGAVADPRRRDPRVALDRGGHRPADGLDVLRAEVAGNREEAVPARRVHDGQLASADRIALVREELAHHVDETVAARDQDSLLAVGREAHVGGLQRRPPGRRRSPPRPGSACRTTASSAAARSACARRRCAWSASRAGPPAAAPGPRCGSQGPTARPSSSSTRTSAAATSPVCRRPRVHRRPPHRAGGRQVQVREVGGAPGSPGRFGHVQAEGGGLAHCVLLTGLRCKGTVGFPAGTRSRCVATYITP